MNSRRKFKDRSLRNEISELQAQRELLRMRVSELEEELEAAKALCGKPVESSPTLTGSSGDVMSVWKLAFSDSKLEIPIPLTPELMEEVESRYKIGIDPAAPGADRMVEVEIQRPDQ